MTNHQTDIALAASLSQFGMSNARVVCNQMHKQSFDLVYRYLLERDDSRLFEIYVSDLFGLLPVQWTTSYASK